MTSKKGTLIVVSGPSGVGKGTICSEVLKKNPDISVSVSATTRKPRVGDIEGINYFFKNTDEFREMIENGELLEWAKYNDNYYGTPKGPVEDMLNQGCSVILEIETQGALKIKEKIEDSILIFVEPPDFNVLKERLKKRGTETFEEISKRIETAQKEMLLKDKYDYIIVNNDLETAVCETMKIISLYTGGTEK